MDARTPSIDELLGEERWLRALARRLVRDAATADDLVQETWFRALRSRRDEGGVVNDGRAWLVRVLHNVWRERGRSERARGRREARVAASEALPSAREALERVELAQRLAALVLALEEPYRSIVVWRYHEGRSAAAIAAELGEPAARVRWRLMRARELLRARLARERGDWAAHYALFLPLAQRAPAAGAGALGGVGVLSVAGKALVWAGAAALLVWTAVRLAGRQAEPGPGPGPLVSENVAPPIATAGEERVLAAPARAERETIEPSAADAPGTEAPADPANAGASHARLHGTVRAAEDGSVLAGAELGLFSAGGRILRGSTAAGGDGAFLLEDLEPGAYDLACRLQGRLPHRVRGLELAAGTESEVTVRLERGFLVAVEVFERASGAPVPAAEVELVPGDRDAIVWFTAEDLRYRALTGTTGPDGRVELGGAERGLYQTAVRAPGHATALGEALLEEGGEPLRIAVERGGVVHGTVRHASGAPAEGARVFLNPVVYVKAESDRMLRQNGLAADHAGRYRLEGVPAGIYHAVALLPDGSGTFHLDPEKLPERVLAPLVVDVAAEVSLDFRLPEPGEVRGRVVRPDGAPVAGARVSVSWSDFKPGGAGFFPIAAVEGVKESIHHSTHTDDEGRFRIEHLRFSYEPLELDVKAAGHVEAELELDVPAGARLEPVITLQPLGATIRGRLTDGRGEPVAGHGVGAWESQGERLGAFFQTRSNADGSYELVVAASGAQHRVQPLLFSSSPFHGDPAQRDGVLAGASGIDFVLHARALVHGTVVDDAGETVRDFVVHAEERGKEGWKDREANRGEGRFELFVDPAVIAELRFSAPACDPATLALFDADVEHRIVLRRAGDLAGVLRDAAGNGVEGAVVALATLDSAIYPRGVGFAPRAVTDAAGRFRLRGVPDPSAASGAGSPASGHVLVCPRREDAPPLLHYPLPVTRGAELELVLPRSVPVELVFTDPDGNPLEGGLIVVDGAGWPLEPLLEAHLADQASDTRGVLAAGRTRFRLLPGPHHALFVRTTEVEQALPFTVDDPGEGEPALQTRTFTLAAD